MSHHHGRLNVAGFGFASGISWAIGLLVLGWVSHFTGGGWGKAMIDMFASVYIGYKATWGGAVIGAIWGFIDFFIGGVVLAAIYNATSCKHCEHCCKEGGMHGHSSM